MNYTNIYQFKSLWLGLSVIALVWIILIFNLFYEVDRWLYDKEILLPNTRSISSSVILIEADHSFQYESVERWFDMLTKINTLKPKTIIIPSLPKSWDAADRKKATLNFPLFVGEILSDSSEQASINSEYSGVTALPPLDRNAYRQQWLTYVSDTASFDSLELVVARKISGFNKYPGQDRFFIDFRGANGRLPVIESDRVFKGELVESLIKDRIILIGYTDALAPELLTPIGSISFSLFQAYALDTLLKNNQITQLSLIFMMLIILLIVISLLIIIPNISDRYQLASLVFIVFATLILSWLFLNFFELWLQPGILIIAEVSIFFILYFERNNQQKNQIRNIAFKSASSIESRWLSKSFYSTEEHWTQIANMVSQTLSLNRTIFLERVENDHRVKEIKALNCSVDDVHEMRRDYFRKPYTTAIEKGGVLRLDREYLINSTEPEIQYLVPLSYSGEIQGFWALSIAKNHHLEEKKIIYAVEQFSLQISEMLFHRTQWLKHQAYQSKPLVRLLNLKFDELAYSTINRSIKFMAQRLTVMESLMDGIETSVILYDLFGRVVQVNKSMSAQLADINLAPYSLTATDLISLLTSCSAAESRNYMSYVILEKGSITLPVKHENIDKVYTLSVRGLFNNGDHMIAEEEVRPFEIIGVLCEVIDMSRINDICLQKEKVIDHLRGWLKNDLSSISLACDLAKDDRLSSEKRTNVLDMVKVKVDGVTKTIERVNDIIQSDLVMQASARYPVDCQEPLLAAIASIKKTQTKNIEIKTDFPSFIPLVIASTSELRNIFDNILTLLYSDVIENGSISIEMHSGNSTLEFLFFNQGFGLPNEYIQSYLKEDDIQGNEEFKALRTIKHHIDNWDGKFNVHSAVGEGMRFTFILESFQPNE